MHQRIIPIKYEVIEDVVEPGLHASELDSYLVSRSFRRRVFSLPTRRGILLGLAVSAVPTGFTIRQAEAVGLIDAGIEFVRLASDAWDLYEKIKGKLGLSSEKPRPTQGAVLNAVKAGSYVQASTYLSVEVPEGARVSIIINGPAPKTIDADTFMSKTAIDINETSITVSA